MLRQLRVLQVNKFYPPLIGGIEKVVQQIVEGLSERCHMKVLVCQRKGPESDEVINGVQVHRSASIGTFCSMPLSFAFLKDFRRMSTDSNIVHIHMPFPLADLACLLSGYKGAVVVWWHSDIVRQKAFMPLYRPLMNWLLRRSDKIIVATQRHITGSKYLPAYQDKCVVIPFSLDRQILGDAKDYGNTKKGTTHEGSPFRFLFVGRLVPYKGCGVLLDAFAKLGEGQLTIAGDGPQREKLLRQSQKLGISERVRFIRQFTEKEKMQLYRDCDAFILPSISKNEAFGLVQLEAMAYGKPVINTDLDSGVPEVSLHNVTGLTVPPNDSVQLARAMERLIHDDDLCRSFGAAAVQRAVSFSENFADQLYAVYEEALEK